ncbi:MAG: hypothetical protein JNL08_19350 [Planctomycetes bacterium]|nr:hypothetical protein [Planctomycetota bacterium]
MAARRAPRYHLRIAPPSPHLPLRLAILIGALVDRAWRVDGLVDGDHFFRQAHVLANVDGMLAHGLAVAPGTWNDDLFLHFYDFPVYQGLCAVLARATGLAAPLVAEATNVAALGVLLLATWRLGERLALGALATTAALLLLALAPLGRFWFAAPSLDPFVVTLGTVSLAAWLDTGPDARPARRRVATAVWLGTAFVATLAKSPTYLPVAVAILAAIVRRHGVAGLRRGPTLAFVAVLAAAQLLFVGIGAHANADARGWPDRATELAWYFGSAAERFAIGPHAEVLARIAKQVLSVPVTITALVVLVARLARPDAGRTFVTVWSLAAVGASLLFLHVNVVHGYYQLPCLVPLALCGGAATAALADRLRARRRTAAAVLLALAAAATWSSERYLARLGAASTATIRAAGAFVQQHTAPADYVLYARPTADDNPVFLYCAQRHGANVTGDLAPAALTATFAARATARGGRLVLFAPADVAAPTDGTPLAAGPAGRLWLLP